MKVIAISQRGRKRDFIDFYWYCKNHHILKSFMYFQDAEDDPMPKIFFDATWREIKKYFQREVPQITPLPLAACRV